MTTRHRRHVGRRIRKARRHPVTPRRGTVTVDLTVETEGFLAAVGRAVAATGITAENMARILARLASSDWPRQPSYRRPLIHNGRKPR